MFNRYSEIVGISVGFVLIMISILISLNTVRDTRKDGIATGCKIVYQNAVYNKHGEWTTNDEGDVEFRWLPMTTIFSEKFIQTNEVEDLEKGLVEESARAIHQNFSKMEKSDVLENMEHRIMGDVIGVIQESFEKFNILIKNSQKGFEGTNGVLIVLRNWE